MTKESSGWWAFWDEGWRSPHLAFLGGLRAGWGREEPCVCLVF